MVTSLMIVMALRFQWRQDRVFRSEAPINRPRNTYKILGKSGHRAPQAIVAGALALGTGHAQHIELADEIAEYDGTVAGHFSYSLST
jgi:hypothetical protein